MPRPQKTGKAARNMKQKHLITQKEKTQMNDKNTQMKRLLKLFKTTHTLTVQSINDRMSLNSPRKVISDLRAKGVPIKDRYIEEVNSDGVWTHFKEYWIEPSWFEGDDHDNLL